MTENEAINYLRQIDPKHIECVELIDMKEVWENIPQAISVLEKALKEIQQYRAIGTVEECLDAMERKIPKVAKEDTEESVRYCMVYVCPSCNKKFTGGSLSNNCYHCGQAFKWETKSD